MEDSSSQSFGQWLKHFFRRSRNADNAEKFEEDMQELIEDGAEKGVITLNEGEMIQGVIELGETETREIMTPRTSIIAVAMDTSIGQVIDLIIKNGHSRLPIYEGDIDHVTGVLHAKDLLPYWGLPATDPLPADISRPLIFVPATKKIVDLLAEVRGKKSHLAIVLDEYGGTAGLVTLEDIIEEIVGDIHDEYDVEEETIIRTDENTILVDARIELEELSDYLGKSLPEGNYTTLGGFLTHLTGRVPQSGENLEFEDLVMTIRSADERKINQVEIKHPEAPGGQKTTTT